MSLRIFGQNQPPLDAFVRHGQMGYRSSIFEL